MERQLEMLEKIYDTEKWKYESLKKNNFDTTSNEKKCNHLLVLQDILCGYIKQCS